MKKIILILSILHLNSLFAQTLPKFDEIKLDQPADYKNADSIVIQTANYLLSTPFEKDNLERAKSLQFVINWMAGTPDYTFSIDNLAGKLIKENEDLFGIYMACMAKYCLENKPLAKNKKLVKLHSVQLLLTYCENPMNGIKLTEQLKKLSESMKQIKKGELEKEL